MSAQRSLFPRVVFSSKSDEWATPDATFRELDREFGFTLDPCATDKTAKCDRYYTIETDGLSHSWAGEVVFMNPPYSSLKRWMHKAFTESRRGAIVVCLVPARTDTAWFHELAIAHGEVRFIRGRLRFKGAAGFAPFPSIVVVFRPEQ